LPASRANFAMLIGELEGFNETKCLIDRSANWQIIDGDLPAGSQKHD
jgi:hypothetical protein